MHGLGDVAPGVLRTLTIPLTAHDRLVGVTWAAGAPQVSVRWHGAGGWTAWETADDDSAAPEPAERQSARPGTEPMWRPDGADRAELRVTAGGAAVTGSRLVAVSDGLQSGVGHGSFGAVPAEAADGAPLLGRFFSRREWGANESMRRGAPAYASRVSAVVVHHTVQSNSYSASDVPRLIRADYAYHVQSRGWSDLGYNMLVDRFGRVWEGRYGGLRRATIGAHAQGFNTGTLGVAVLGDMTKTTPSPAALDALARVTAYAARTWGFDPTQRVTLTSGGSPRYEAGRRVTVRRVFGHRDTGLTSCPGASLYARLGSIRDRGLALPGPARFVSTRVTGTPVRAPSAATMIGYLNVAAPWTVTR